MKQIISFILNDKEITIDIHPGSILLDFIRYKQHLIGTKIGCREGDCGACTVLVGELDGEQVKYQAITSCLTPMGNVEGKHVVTIEGINQEGLNPVQEKIAECGGTQCGFCTPGFVMSLMNFSLDDNPDPIDAINGNICRCTGYKSLEKAALQISEQLQKINGNGKDIQALIEAEFIPDYFLNIKQRLLTINQSTQLTPRDKKIVIGGGTDLYVQIPDKMKKSDLVFVNQLPDLNFLHQEGTTITIGAGVTASGMENSTIAINEVPGMKDFYRLFASRLIKNTATIGGNLVNASPIADFTILFLALDSNIQLTKGDDPREISLKQFYLEYKKLDLKKDELVEAISFELPKGLLLNFEKVSKRTHLDIASVNSAMSVILANDKISQINISAGGVAPIPKFLSKTVDFLRGKPISPENVKQAASIAQEEVSPISDIRGSAKYKSLLLRQLIYAHFLKLFPDKVTMEELIT
jgi:xanthine dehydrogenase small subunit